MILRSLLILAAIFTPAYVFAQQAADPAKDNSAVALEELEAIIIEAGKLDDKNAAVNIRSKAAMLVSYSDPVRAESMFLALWKFVNDQTDEGLDKQQARLVVLKYLSSRNPKLARQLLSEQTKAGDSSTASRTADRDVGPRLTAKLASELIDTDPSAAAGLLESSLPRVATPAGLGALSRLREKDPFLSDYVAGRVVEGLAAQPTRVSLPGLFLLGAYIFPGAETVIPSPEAEASLQLLQYRYFLASLDVLRASLGETREALVRDQQYLDRDLQMRAAYQGQVAAILAALAPRLHPSSAAELAAIATRLAPQVPASIAQMIQFTLARLSGNQIASEDPEQRFVFALSKGDLEEARKQLDRLKDGERKNIYTQLLIKVEARAFLAKSDVMGALSAIRKLEDQTTRLVMYLDAVKVAKKKRDSAVMSIVINEARLLIPQTDRNGLHVRALLSFAAHMATPEAIDDAMEFLKHAGISMNRMGRTSNEKKESQNLAEAAMAELNDPNSLLDAAEFEQAFSSLGLADLDRTLAEAKKIEMKPLQLAARLVTVQNVIKRGRKVLARPAKASSDPKQ